MTPALPVALSGYRIMWMFVLFDLPVGTPRERKAATRFRKDRGGRLCLDSFPLSISGSSAGCRRGVPFSGWHAGMA
jgi:hypothetical protein